MEAVGERAADDVGDVARTVVLDRDVDHDRPLGLSARLPLVAGATFSPKGRHWRPEQIAPGVVMRWGDYYSNLAAAVLTRDLGACRCPALDVVQPRILGVEVQTHAPTDEGSQASC